MWKILKSIKFFMLRWETRYTPGAGITAVANQERLNSTKGIIVAPLHVNLSATASAMQNGLIKSTGIFLPVLNKNVEIFITNDVGNGIFPMIYLKLENCFQGKISPYNTKELRRDALYFGLSIRVLFEEARRNGVYLKALSAADWEMVPAMYAVKQAYPDDIRTILTIHNHYDEYFLNEELNIFCNEYAPFYTQSALEYGIENADVLTTVNEGYAFGLKYDPYHKAVLNSELIEKFHRRTIIGINNAPFEAPSKAWIKIMRSLYGDDLKLNFSNRITENALRDFFSYKEKCRIGLERELTAILEKGEKTLCNGLKEPATSLEVEETRAGVISGNIQSVKDIDIRNKIVLLSMGRLVPQKQFGCIVHAFCRILESSFPDKNKLLLVISPLPTGLNEDATNINMIKKLKQDFPSQVIYYSGRCPYYLPLRSAADFSLMSSIYEPHGEVFIGTGAIPIARAVDGVAQQICDPNFFDPSGNSFRIWHNTLEEQTGILYREQSFSEEISKGCYRELIATSLPSHSNEIFNGIVESLIQAIENAVILRLYNEDKYARITRAVIKKQAIGYTWKDNLEKMQKVALG